MNNSSRQKRPFPFSTVMGYTGDRSAYEIHRYYFRTFRLTTYFVPSLSTLHLQIPRVPRTRASENGIKLYRQHMISLSFQFNRKRSTPDNICLESLDIPEQANWTCLCNYNEGRRLIRTMWYTHSSCGLPSDIPNDSP